MKLCIVETKYGILSGVSSVELYENGKVKECSVDEKIVINTPVGQFIPQYTNEDVRTKYIKALSFYDSGYLKKIALQEQSIVNTSIGSIKAELITFYESGSIKRIFPLNGKLTGYWSEENEYELATALKFDFSFGSFEKKVISIHFYENGKIKSLTLWPKEAVTLETPMGKFRTRFGLSIYSEGDLASMEPAYPLTIETPIGKISAFDMSANGINGDINSLNFYEDGNVMSLITSTDSIIMTDKKGINTVFEPGLEPSILDEDGMDVIPLKVEFTVDKKIKINDNPNLVFDITAYSFTIRNNDFKTANKCGSCSSCNGCA